MTLNRWLARLSKNGGPALRMLMQLQLKSMRRNPGRVLDAMARQLPPYDQALIADPEFREMMMDDLRSTPATARSRRRRTSSCSVPIGVSRSRISADLCIFSRATSTAMFPYSTRR